MTDYLEPKSAEEFVIPQDRLAIVYLTATWCGPCRAIAPLFTKLANENPNVVFIKVDVDLCSAHPLCASVSGVPTFISYKNGSKVEEFTGSAPAKLENLVKSIQA